MRYASYFRISTDETRQKFSLEAQRDSAVKHLESIKDGGTLVKEYSDEASGKNMERPNLQRMLADARGGKFDCILVYKVDRLSRCLRDICQVMEDLDNCGVAFRSITEPFDTSTPIGKAFIQILGVFAELERENICDRTRIGMERKVSQGEWVGHPPFGYDYCADEKRLIPNRGEAIVIDKIFKWYVHDRMGSKTIGLRLNEMGIRTKNGKRWASCQIISKLKNPVYIGKIKRNGTVYDGNHKAIVSEEIWDKAQIQLEERRKNYSKRRSNGSKFLFTGPTKCGICGANIYGMTGTGKNKQKCGYYICGGRKRFGTCEKKNIPQPLLETAIIRQVTGLLSNSDLFQDVEKKALELMKARQPDVKGELKAVESDIQKRQATKQRYLRAFEANTLPEDECGGRLREIGQELHQLNARKAELEETCRAEVKPITKDEIKKALTKFTDVLKDSPYSLQKSILKSLVKKIVVLPDDMVEVIYSLSGVRQLLATGS